MSTQYRLVQSGETASGGCSGGQGSSEPVAPRILQIKKTVIKLQLFYQVISLYCLEHLTRAIQR
jgi:hypothetical protein